MQRCQEVKEKLEVWGPRATSTVQGLMLSPLRLAERTVKKRVRLIGMMVLKGNQKVMTRVNCALW